MRARNQTVLGLCSFTHDSAAALLAGGRLVGFVEEERLTGVKHTRDYPHLAIDWLLDQAGISTADVDTVAYNFAGRRHLAALTGIPRHLAQPATCTRALPRAASFTKVYRRYRTRMELLQEHFHRAQIRPIVHHRAHGLYAFAASGYEHAAVLVVDSLGETATTTVAIGHRGDTRLSYRTLHTLNDPASLGYAYGAVTEHLGWRRGDEEGTVMALAALGDPGRFRRLFARGIRLTETGFTLDPRLFALRVPSRRYPRLRPQFIASTCPPRDPLAQVEPVHADLAAALQERTEQVMLHLARQAQQVTGARRLCLGGGVAMNCVSVGTIAAAGLFDEVFVPPAPGDSGTAIGAALAAHDDLGLPMPEGLVGECYLGPAYSDLHLDRHPRPGLTACRVRDAAWCVAEELAAGQIVGCFRGALEAGPRALGHRSILASPLQPDVVERLNATVKFREPFRPFAPVTLADQAHTYFTLGQPSPFMAIASGVTDRARAEIPATVHANGTARVQTVTAASEPFLAEVLAAFEDLTGTPVLINTSLNVKGQPICGTPDMALDCLTGSGLDALLLEDWWVTK
ncbi:MAG TPA: carbamoyltransferase C-terminal domain-containing protein [Kineosporiaceae bacterium]